MTAEPAPAPRLSLCIPTFNRADCLDVLLTSAAAQHPPFDEIVVSDDASGDDTPEVLARWSAKLTYLRTHRLAVNQGLDANFREVVARASGDFIWFMGDDDRLRPGAVAAAKAALAAHPDVLGATVGVVDYDNQLQRPTGLRRRIATRTLCGAEAVFSQMADLLGFMSSTLVRRSAWREALAPDESRTHDKLYSQVYRIGRMLKHEGRWLVLDELLIDFRSDNDQFRAQLGGHLPRLRRDVEAYSEIFDDLFADAPAALRRADALILVSHVLSRVRNAKLQDPDFPVRDAFRLLRRRYGGHAAFWTRIAPSLIAPSWGLAFARRLYQRLSPASGAVRAKGLSQSVVTPT